MKKAKKQIPVVIFLIFLAAGIFIFRYYRASADEHLEIDVEHIIGKFLFEKLRRPFPGPIADA